MRSLILTLLLATPAWAQDGPVYDGALLAACLEGAGDNPRQCIGKGSAACMNMPGGESTVGMGICLEAETLDWDKLLNIAYDKVLGAAQAADAELKTLGSAAPPAAPSLRQAQRAWISFRDASCLYADLQFQGGTAGGPAALACMMELTAEQALRLRAMARE